MVWKLTGNELDPSKERENKGIFRQFLDVVIVGVWPIIAQKRADQTSEKLLNGKTGDYTQWDHDLIGKYATNK